MNIPKENVVEDAKDRNQSMKDS